MLNLHSFFTISHWGMSSLIVQYTHSTIGYHMCQCCTCVNQYIWILVFLDAIKTLSSSGIWLQIMSYRHYKSYNRSCKVMSDVLANVTWNAFNVVSSVVLSKCTHYFISHHGEPWSANCSKMFWLSMRHFSQSFRCSDYLCFEQCHFSLTLWWPWQVNENTYSMTVRHYFTSLNVTFTVCSWYYMWVYSNTILLLNTFK